MSGGFLDRWSRRKREADAAAAKPADKTAAPPTATPSELEPAGAAKAAEAADTAFDPASLPPIDSIGADTDVRAFLRPDVPAELRDAALRRAWASDPAIRDFVELVENGWDFNDPNAMAGFGPISSEEVKQLVGRLFDLPAAQEPTLNPASEPAPKSLEKEAQSSSEGGESKAAQLAQVRPLTAASSATRPAQAGDDDALPQQSSDDTSPPPVRRKRHGGAVPK